jgi:hypothetical protein
MTMRSARHDPRTSKLHPRVIIADGVQACSLPAFLLT